ncbi:hypothetical protein TrVE_jg7277 [Triparma verrucosa]|uniref:VOC domain-containing protein n=2 Tax=Triparma TaxID=722752 RepID=A0A9W7AJL9_9STRA|nr:hypothetical protein TrST_g2565 [Triparma strigata]GMI00865.1 hypothetical protein TrVE_jg7277 [Triparma verrucosa]
MSLSRLSRFASFSPSFSLRSFSSSNAVKPFRILGVQQIALGSLSLSGLSSLWVDTFEAKEVKRFKSEKENVDEIVTEIGRGLGKVEIDLMMPLDPTKSPKVNTPALNHLGLWVDDLPSAVSYLESKSFKFTPGGIRPGAAGHDICFLHPKPKEGKGGEGVLIELVQAPKSVIDMYDSAPEE